ncbi:MAG: hypothetical protein GTO13_01295 [Proteobacteria bacterium]|nr:hypothetical protein [Pseudomonadota bacterium]
MDHLTDKESQEPLGCCRLYHLGLGINAGLFLSHFNLRRLAKINQIEATPIEHSMVPWAVLVGLDRAV